VRCLGSESINGDQDLAVPHWRLRYVEEESLVEDNKWLCGPVAWTSGVFCPWHLQETSILVYTSRMGKRKEK